MQLQQAFKMNDKILTSSMKMPNLIIDHIESLAVRVPRDNIALQNCEP